jgi:hypothetical protein
MKTISKIKIGNQKINMNLKIKIKMFNMYTKRRKVKIKTIILFLNKIKKML